MKVHEYQAKALLREFGVAVPKGDVADTPAQAKEIAQRLGGKVVVKAKAGIGYCNITKCCSEVCPEHIHITDNAIIPLKERVVTEFYDPIAWVKRRLSGT